MISLVPSESWGFFKWVWASARKWGVGPCPAQSVWQGSGFAADQTNAMLAVGGTSCISLVSVAAADENSLTPLHRRLPTEIASLGFGGSPVGGGDKSSRFAFSAFPCGGGIITLRPLYLCWNNPARGLFRQKNGFLRVGALRRRTHCSLLHAVLFWHLYAWGGITALGPLWLCRNNPARGLFQQKKRLSQSGCSAPTDTLFPPAHSAFLAFLYGGGITTLGVRFMPLKRWTPAGHGGVFAVFMPPQNSPCAG